MSQRSFTSRTARPALILGVSATILSLGLSACSLSTSGTRKPSNGPRPRGASATADTQTQSHIGECFQFGPNEDSDVTKVDCNQPHDGEYFHIFDFEGTTLPSDDEFDEESDEICGLIFEHYVGTPFADSTLDYDWILPSSQTWAKGDHMVQCYVFAKDGSKLTGSGSAHPPSPPLSRPPGAGRVWRGPPTIFTPATCALYSVTIDTEVLPDSQRRYPVCITSHRPRSHHPRSIMSRVSTRTLALASSVAALSMTLSACALGGNTSAFNVEVGQCVQLPDGSTVSRVEVVECTAEHDGEVYHIEKLTDKERPSEDWLNMRMESICSNAFEGYVGAAYEDSDLRITTMFPTEASWKRGDRDIVCIAISNDGEKLSQSVKDSGM